MNEKEHLRAIIILVVIEYVISIGAFIFTNFIDSEFWDPYYFMALVYLVAAMSITSFVMAVRHLIIYRNEHTELAITFLVLSILVLLCSMGIIVIVAAINIICGSCHDLP